MSDPRSDSRSRRWDFFISYTAADLAWAEWIAWELEAAGYQVLFQKWDFVPGSHWTTRMREGIHGAERTLAILSPAYLTSVYGQAEWAAAYRADPRGFTRKLIPVRVQDCQRPELLAGVVSFDLFDCPADTARRRLLNKIAEALSGRAKPSTAPAFPGPMPAPLRLPPPPMPVVSFPPQASPPIAPAFPGTDLLGSTGVPFAVRSAKILVAGDPGAGKRDLINSVSEIAPLTTETITGGKLGDPGWSADTVATDFGRCTMDNDLILYLFSTPDRTRWWFMWDDLVRDALGAIVLVDGSAIDGCRPVVEFFRSRGLPYLIAVDRPTPVDAVRSALAVPPDVPVTGVNPRSRESAKNALISLVEHAITRQRSRVAEPHPV
jgi:signal recognition particle receptor subunit beta